jgi:hypothetical protein
VAAAKVSATPAPEPATLVNAEMPRTDPKKVDFIDELYPLVHQLSETYVDAFGNKSGDWRESFINGLTDEWLRMMNAELRLLSEKFGHIRGSFDSHRFYADIYEMDDKIAQRINAIGSALTTVREVAEKLSYNFDDKSVDLVTDQMKAVFAAIGALRSYLSRDCLGGFITMRQAALGQLVETDR